MESIAADAHRQCITLDDPPEDEQTPFESRAVEADGRDKELAQHGQRHTSRPANRVRHHRDVAPAEQAQALGSAGPERDSLALFALIRVLRKHRHPDAI